MKRLVMLNLAVALVLSLPIFCSGQGLNKDADAVAAVKAFYAFHFSHKFDYTERGLRQRRRWLDESLYKLLIAEVKGQHDSARQDEVADLDGDPFTNSQDYPDSFRVGKAQQDARKATVEVTFLWIEKK